MQGDPLKLRPDLYRSNAFRILGLSTATTFKAVTKREQRLNTAIEMDDKDAIKQLTIGAFMGLSDEPTIRSSSSRLGDPHQRLIDELFWLRPPDDEEDAVQKLRQSRPEGIVDLLTQWEIAEESSDEEANTRATHSLAVFHHMLAIEVETAIDKELRSRKPQPASLEALKKIAEYCWYAALPRWRAVLASQQTWNWLHDRALAIDKRRLGPEDVESVQRDAEAALLGIIVELMRRAAREQWVAEIERFRSIVQRSGFKSELLDAAARNTVGPDIEELDSQMATFTTRCQADKTIAKELTLRLFNELEPKIKALRLLLNKDDPRLTALEDSFAAAANTGQIANWNHDKDDDFSLDVLKRIKPYIHSPQLMNKIDLDIEDTLCFFCKERPRRLTSSCDVAMWRIADVEPILGSYSLATQTIRVPRCQICAGKGKSGGTDQNRLVKKERGEGWRLGTRPSQEDIRSAFLNARTSGMGGLLGRLR